MCTQDVRDEWPAGVCQVPPAQAGVPEVDGGSRSSCACWAPSREVHEYSPRSSGSAPTLPNSCQS